MASITACTLVTVKGSLSFHTDFLGNLNKFRKSQTYTDVTITSQKLTLHCHHLVLAGHSPVLAAMLSSGFKESQSNRINFDSFSPAVIQAIVDYMYTGEITLDNDDLEESIQICDYLELTSLCHELQKYVIAHMNLANVLPWYQFSFVQGLEKVKDCCKRIMYLSFESATETEEFYDITENAVMEFLGRYHEFCDFHDAALVACMRWLEKHPQDFNLFLEMKLDKCSETVLQKVLDEYIFCDLLSENAREDVEQALHKVQEQPVLGPYRLTFITNNAAYVHNQEKALVKILNLPFHRTKWKHTNFCEIPGGFVTLEEKNWAKISAIGDWDFSLSKCVLPFSMPERLPSGLYKPLEGGELHQQNVIFHNGYIYLFGMKSEHCDRYKLPTRPMYQHGSRGRLPYDGKWEIGPNIPPMKSQHFWGMASLNGDLYIMSDDGTLFLLKDDEFEEIARVDLLTSMSGGKCTTFSNFCMTVHQEKLYLVAWMDEKMKVMWYSPLANAWYQLSTERFMDPVEDVEARCLIMKTTMYIILCRGRKKSITMSEYNLEKNKLGPMFASKPSRGYWWITALRVPESLCDGKKPARFNMYSNSDYESD